MTYEIVLGDYAYSSWSLRGWLLLDAFGLKARSQVLTFYQPAFHEALAAWSPARTVPALRLPEGPVIADSLAIAEELAARHPGAGHWPTAPGARAVARHLAAEMHSSFSALRGHCPMNLRVAYADCAPPQAVLDDVARIETLWAWARAETGATGPWLCGDYSVADVFFAPIAARIAGHSLPVGPDAAAYVQTHLEHGPFRRWRAMALVHGPDQATYARDWPTKAWPAPAPIDAATCDGPSINTACPYSGKPVTHFLRAQNCVIGFCNAFCRDKTAADPMAWPEIGALLQP